MATAAAWLMAQNSLRAKEDQYSGAEEFAILESFLVHPRNLHDFLKPRTDKVLKERETKPRSHHAGSVWALDFVPGFGVETFDTETIRSINHWLQHITTWRQEDEEHPGWKYLSMLQSIYVSTHEFLRADLDAEIEDPLNASHQEAAALLAAVGLFPSG